MVVRHLRDSAVFIRLWSGPIRQMLARTTAVMLVLFIDEIAPVFVQQSKAWINAGIHLISRGIIVVSGHVMADYEQPIMGSSTICGDTNIFTWFSLII